MIGDGELEMGSEVPDILFGDSVSGSGEAGASSRS